MTPPEKQFDGPRRLEASKRKKLRRYQEWAREAVERLREEGLWWGSDWFFRLLGLGLISGLGAVVHQSLVNWEPRSVRSTCGVFLSHADHGSVCHDLSGVSSEMMEAHPGRMTMRQQAARVHLLVATNVDQEAYHIS